MLTIDGAYCEGGGQLARNAVALSAITGTPVTISRIRAMREKPGLAAQHVAAIRAVACQCNATVTGVSPGSSSITFSPGTTTACDSTIAVGTAGSIPLVIQAWLPVALLTGGRLRVTGGTEVPMSPTIDYLDHVLAGVLRRAGAEIRIDVLRRGYYPAGGGDVVIEVTRKNISPLSCSVEGEDTCRIASNSSNLPDHVVRRQAGAAEKYLAGNAGISCDIVLDCREGPDTGSSCTISRGPKGGSALGKRGLPAERVGETAARSALTEFGNGADVDMFLSDQLLVPLALFGGSYSSPVITSHAETTIWLLGQFGFEIRCTQGTPVEFSA